MALVHNFSTQITNLEKLKQIAACAGYVQTRGPQKGKGSIRQMLEALIEDRAIVQQATEETLQNEEVLRDLEIQRMLLADGLIHEIKPINKRTLSPFDPIKVDGEPVSKMIIRERR